MRILEYFFAAFGACLVAFFGYMALAGVAHFDLYPEPYALFVGLAIVYTAFRAWLDRKIAPGRKFPTAAEGVAIGAFVCFVAISVWMGRAHSTPRIQRSSAYQGNSILAASPATMMDLFMQAHRFLLSRGFHPTSQPLTPMGDISDMTPNMIGLNYIGSYGDSVPFVFRLNADRQGNMLVPAVGQEGATDEKYDKQVKATEEFIDLFNKTMNESKNAQPLTIEKAAARVEQAIAGAAPTGAPLPVEVQITIHKDDSIEVDGTAVPMASLKDELGRRLSKDGQIVVTLISEPGTKTETAENVLKVCEELKIGDVTFALAEGD